MSFTPKELRIIPTGLNLVAPGDQIGEGDCVQLDGWWPGSAGKLVQAKGWTRKNAGEVGAIIDTIAECNGQILYAGESVGVGYLYQVGHDGAGAYIDSGFDGYPIGTCSYQNRLWVMNRAKQRRVNPATATATDWKVIDPPTAPSVVLSTGGGLEDGEHKYYVSYVDAEGYESSPSPVAAVPSPPGELNEGTVSLTMGSPTVTLTGSTWDASIDGMYFLVPEEYPTIVPPRAAPYTIAYVDATHGTLSANWAGITESGMSYRAYVDGNSGKATITRPTAAGVTSWNVYRWSPSMDAPYRVNVDPIPYATATYIDYGDAAHEQDTDAVLSNGVTMEGDHGPAPAARILADRPYNGRLVAANSEAHPNRIYFTNALEPSYFPEKNYVDVGDDSGDAILSISVKPGMLLIYRQRSIWRHIGDLGEGTLEPLVPNMGIIGPRAVAQSSTGDLIIGVQGKQMGIFRITDWERKLSARVETVLNGAGAEMYFPVGATAPETCALGVQLGRVWFSYPTGSQTHPTRTLIYDADTDRWMARAGGFNAFINGSSYFLGATGGGVHSIEEGYTQDGTAVDLSYRSRYEDCGNPDVEKSWADLVVSHNTTGVDLDVYAVVNKGASAFKLATLNSSGLTRSVIPIVYPAGDPNAGKPIESFNLAVQIVGDGAASGLATIDGPLILHYFPKPRKALTFDSGPTDHGQPGAKIVDMIEVDYDGGGGTLYVWSDVPGGTLTERTSGIALAAHSGRKILRVPITPVTGRILRYQITWTSEALVYRVRPRILPVGVYVDGSFGDTWYTTPIAAGVD